MTGMEKKPPAPCITAGPARLADTTAVLSAAPPTTAASAIVNHLMGRPPFSCSACTRRRSSLLQKIEGHADRGLHRIVVAGDHIEDADAAEAVERALTEGDAARRDLMGGDGTADDRGGQRSEEHTSELQSLMRTS